MKWIYISFFAFILSILVAASLMIWGRSIIGPDKAIIYLIILVLLSAGSALFLFKTVRSYATLKGQFLNYKLELAGPIVVFFLVIMFGYNFYRNPPITSQDLTVMFTDPQGSGKNLTGTAMITYKTRTEIIPITLSHGMFPAVQVGDKIKIVPKIEGYIEEATISEIPGPGDPITITLKKDNELENAVLNLKSKFLSVINLYRSNAQDFGEILNANKERIVEFDSAGYIEMENVSARYAEAYFTLIKSSDSLIYLIRPYSVGIANQLDSLKAKALAIHTQYFLRYNGYVDNLNEYRRQNYISPVKKEIMVENLKNLSADIIASLTPMKSALDIAQKTL